MPDPNIEMQHEVNLTTTSLRVAANALRDEPYQRLPTLAAALEIAADRMDRLWDIARKQSDSTNTPARCDKCPECEEPTA